MRGRSLAAPAAHLSAARACVQQWANALRARTTWNGFAVLDRVIAPRRSGREKVAAIAFLRALSRELDDPYALFAIARYVFSRFDRQDLWREAADLLPAWCRATLTLGRYRACLGVTSGLLRHRGGRGTAPQQISLSLNRAKALRNLGRPREALEEYRRALALAQRLRLHSEVSWTLALIGKLYGNYLGQASLASSLAQEARDRFASRLKLVRKGSEPWTALHGRLAVCEDVLGQSYRQSDPKRSEGHFQRALDLNRVIGRANGVSRVLCHIHFARFLRARSRSARERSRAGFRQGLTLVLGDDVEYKGLAIRLCQYGTILNALDRREEARSHLDTARSVAVQFSDYRTLARIFLAQARLLLPNDPEGCLSLLREGQAVAKRYRLRRHEAEINEQMALIVAAGTRRDLSAHELFRRNRTILRSVIDDVRVTLRELDSQPERLPLEFRALSSRTRARSSERLVIDLESTLQSLDANLDASSVALARADQRRQEALVVQVANSVAREVLHEVKAAIPETRSAGPLEVVAREIRRLASGMAAGVAVAGTAESLEEQAQQIETVDAVLARLRDLLTERLRRPRQLDERVSLRSAWETAAGELGHLLPELARRLDIHSDCDLVLLSSTDLVVTAVRELLRNAWEALPSGGPPDLRIRLATRVERRGDPRVGNPARAAVVTVLTEQPSEDDVIASVRRIEAALAQRHSAKAGGTGVGLDVVRLAFEDLLGARVSAGQEAGAAGLRIEFPLGTGYAETAALDGQATARNA